jgi:hypothetical protein
MKFKVENIPDFQEYDSIFQGSLFFKE